MTAWCAGCAGGRALHRPLRRRSAEGEQLRGVRRERPAKAARGCARGHAVEAPRGRLRGLRHQEEAAAWCACRLLARNAPGPGVVRTATAVWRCLPCESPPGGREIHRGAHVVARGPRGCTRGRRVRVSPGAVNVPRPHRDHGSRVRPQLLRRPWLGRHSPIVCVVCPPHRPRWPRTQPPTAPRKTRRCLHARLNLAFAWQRGSLAAGVRCALRPAAAPRKGAKPSPTRNCAIQ